MSRSFWRWFWAAWLLVLPLVDPWREQDDIAHDRTHSDGTTLSATMRWALEKLIDLLGPKIGPRLVPWLFKRAARELGEWLGPHIVDHLDSQQADW